MCIKAGNTELSSVKALMTMSLNAVVAEVFGMEPDEIRPGLRVFDDLHMTPDQQSEFAGLVAEFFDGLQVEFTPTTTLDEIFDHVIEQEFLGLPADAF
jgi:hypothetical protein